MKIIVKLSNSFGMSAQDPKQRISSTLAHITHKIFIKDIKVLSGQSESDFFGNDFGMMNSGSHLMAMWPSLNASSTFEKNFGIAHTRSLHNSLAGNSSSYFNNKNVTVEITCSRQGGSEKISSIAMRRLISEAISHDGRLTLESFEDEEGQRIDMQIEAEERIKKQNIDMQNKAEEQIKKQNQALPRFSSSSNSPTLTNRFSHFSINQAPALKSIVIVDKNDRVFATLSQVPNEFIQNLKELQNVIEDNTIATANNGAIFVLRQDWLMEVNKANPNGITELAKMLNIPTETFREIARLPKAIEQKPNMSL
jgi:hypothetical protein